jgi:hypothetical protein
MFAVPSDYKNHMIISLSNGQREMQFGPVITPADVKSIKEKLENNRIKVGRDILWHAVDLKRILASDELISPLTNILIRSSFKVWKFYEDNKANRENSLAIARLCAIGLSSENKKLTADQSEELIVQADPGLVIRYQENLVYFRMKWMEIQGETHELERYQLLKLDATQKDRKEICDDCTRFKLVQTNWYMR